MTQNDYLKHFYKICNELYDLTLKKNSDYATDKNAFANFEAIEKLTSGRISISDGIIVRITDKLSRIVNLLNQPAKVKSETISDTLTDLAVYSIILRIYLEEQDEQRSAQVSSNSEVIR